MWCVIEVSGVDFLEAAVAPDISQFGQGLPKGFNGQQAKGFSFYELKEYQRQLLR